MGRPQFDRSDGGQLRDRRGLQRRGAASGVRRQAQHPALGQDPLHQGRARLPARRRPDRRALRRPPPGRPGHSGPDLLRGDFRVPGAGRRHRDLQLRGAAASQPEIAIVPGPPVLVEGGPADPAAADRSSAFRLCLKGEDRWGNPSDRCDETFAPAPSLPVEGLPEQAASRRATSGSDHRGPRRRPRLRAT